MKNYTTSGASSTTTNTAGTKGKSPNRPGGVLIGQTFRMLRLEAGLRPFAVVSVDTDNDRASGWVFPDPWQDGNDPILRDLGVQAADRRRPCYITVPTDSLR